MSNTRKTIPQMPPILKQGIREISQKSTALATVLINSQTQIQMQKTPTGKTTPTDEFKKLISGK